MPAEILVSNEYILFPTVKSALPLLFDISLMNIIQAFLSYDFLRGRGRPSILVGGTGRGNEQGEPEHEKSVQNRELKMKSLIGLGFKSLLPFFIFLFPVLVRSHFSLETKGLCTKA